MAENNGNDNSLKRTANLRGKNKKNGDLSSYVFGKVQPQALPLEEAVLGALMLDKDALTVVIDLLRPESFYLESHQIIFKCIMKLFEKMQPVDLLTVTEEVKKEGALEKIGGAYYLVELTNRVASAANIEYHARIIAQKHIQRELIRISTGIIHDAYEDTTDVFDLLDKAEQGLFEITEQNLSRGSENMSTLVSRAVKMLEEMAGKEEGLTGVPSGFTNLDRLTSGWQPSDLIIVAARPGMGKCLGKGTKVVMYDGSLRNVEDVKVGDLLMGDDSTPRKVLSLARGQEQMYWIRQNKGIDYRVNESHILSLKKSRKEGKGNRGEVLNISVKDYLSKSDKFKSNYKGYRVAVEFDKKAVSVEPYFLGIWLGDGTTTKVSITNQDEEIIEYLHEYAEALDFSVTVGEQEGKTPTYSIVGGSQGHRGNSMRTMLNEINVLGDKHIPEEYLINSTENRLELLAGLIDSDGHYLVQSNGYEIAQKKESLARQIKFLCDSLGFRTSLKSKKASIASIGYETTVWRLRIYGDIDKIPVRIERKKANPWKSIVDWKVTGITVEKDIVDDYYGFEIDGNKLFLLEDMTVTHNTSYTLALARNAAMDFNKGVAFFSLEMSNVQLVQRLISMEAEIPGSKLRNGQLEDYEWQQLNSAIEKLSEAPIFIDDTPGINVFELRAKCRRLKMQHDIQMVIIDYLQLMTGGSDQKGNREQEISMISRSLKGLAKELNVPVIALSQLSRAVETRGGAKRPQLSDLRECITGDTLIYLPKTGEYKPVAALEGQNGFEVLAMDENYKLRPAKCLDVWKTGAKEIYEIETQAGYKIRASLNHPFFTIDGWQQVVDLKVGDRIATARTITTNSTSNLKDEEIIILAHMIGDGCYVERQPIHYTSQDADSLDIVEKAAQSLWNCETRRKKDKVSNNCYHIYMPSPYHLTHRVHHPFINLLTKCGGKKARSNEKEIPNEIFKCDNRQVALFIKHLWATDGGIFIRKNRGSHKIHYSTNSFELAKGLQSLLLRFDIQCSIRAAQKEDYLPNYQLSITGKENCLKFAYQIGIFGSKSEKINQLIDIFEAKETNPNSDVISKKLWNKIKSLKKEKGFTERKFQAALDTQYCGSALYKSNISRNRLQRVATILKDEELENIANSDIKWDKIKSITHVGNEETYDIHVENHHNFVANNFIIHNSGAIEQDADIVSFIYRPEYYQILEDEEGNSLKDVGEIIIAKHRNGALETVKLKFTPHFAKFSNLEDPDFANFEDNMYNDSAPITLQSSMNRPDDEGDIPF